MRFMKNTDNIVIKETKYIATVCIILSALLEAVFLILKKWDYTVLLGNLMSAGIGVLNFYLMAQSVVKALDRDEKGAKSYMNFSRTYRMLMITVMVIIGVATPCFNNWAVLVSLFFPRIAVAFHPLFNKDVKKEAEDK